MDHTKLRACGFQVTRLTRNVSEVSFRGTSVLLSDVPGRSAPVVGGHKAHVSAFESASGLFDAALELPSKLIGL